MWIFIYLFVYLLIFLILFASVVFHNQLNMQPDLYVVHTLVGTYVCINSSIEML